ncbi:MAG: ABC transporter substrate-binding protein [Chlorobi bacterium]|nr:MAG: peptide/nickel transport system substrate-binding protein [Chlorobi bacterium OLB7]MBK8910765.1 ABC transporter substrate-binding protein [Chlorobiota bacterium]MBX7217328.1 extracellular solute-binding protein [Candidatus Kapabacteria bacterium]
MKRTARNTGAWLAALLLMAMTVAGCDCGGGNTPPAKGGAAMAITTEDKFKVPPGADPSVSAELGGNGFEKIAADSGWKTGTITPEQMRYIADTNAKKGGQVTISLGEFPATFRQYGKDENSSTTRMINSMVYENLIGVNPLTLEFLPGLASHWKVGEDGQTYWFRIDPRARFSDGHPVTSEDVIATYKLAIDSTILSPYTNSFYGEFEMPVAVSKYIFYVRSKTKIWKNMLYFGGTTILPAHVIGGLSGKQYLEKYQYDMVPGTGPYIVLPNEVEKQKSITLTRRANWWGLEDPLNKGVNNFDKIKLLIVRDERLALEKFRAGELDLYPISRAGWWKDEFDYDEIKRGIVQKRRVYTDNPVGVSGFVFNMRKPPFDDPRIREAFICLFNREQLLEKLMYNQYTATDSYEPNSVYANPNNPKYRYNPERAAQLLAEAGYTTRNNEGILVKNGQPFSIEMAITEGLDRLITPVQQDLRKAGIELKLRNIDGPSNFKLMNERNFTIAWISWGGLLYPNPISSFEGKLADKPNTNNLAGFKNARADELMKKEQVTFDQAERVKILRELDSILMESKQYALAWYGPYTRVAYWNRYGHPDFYIGKISDFQAILTTWWFDSQKAEIVAKGRTDKSVKMEVGETDVKFWPEYNKAHPVEISATGKAESTAKPVDSAKPTMK